MELNTHQICSPTTWVLGTSPPEVFACAWTVLSSPQILGLVWIMEGHCPQQVSGSQIEGTWEHQWNLK